MGAALQTHSLHCCAVTQMWNKCTRLEGPRPLTITSALFTKLSNANMKSNHQSPVENTENASKAKHNCVHCNSLKPHKTPVSLVFFDCERVQHDAYNNLRSKPVISLPKHTFRIIFKSPENIHLTLLNQSDGYPSQDDPVHGILHGVWSG